MLEVCVDTYESAIIVDAARGRRIELCSALSEGGLTPSTGLLKTIKKHVRNLIARYTHFSISKLFTTGSQIANFCHVTTTWRKQFCVHATAYAMYIGRFTVFTGCRR